MHLTVFHDAEVKLWEYKGCVFGLITMMPSSFDKLFELETSTLKVRNNKSPH